MNNIANGLEVIFSSRGAISELEFAETFVSVDYSTWGWLKTVFR